jgi:hypothetical protein
MLLGFTGGVRARLDLQVLVSGANHVFNLVVMAPVVAERLFELVAMLCARQRP